MSGGAVVIIIDDEKDTEGKSAQTDGLWQVITELDAGAAAERLRIMADALDAGTVQVEAPLVDESLPKRGC